MAKLDPPTPFVAAQPFAADEVDEEGRRPPELFQEDPQRVRVASPEQEEAAEGEEVTTLSDEERWDFTTLMQVGRRTKTINIFDHTVVIQNLTNDDDLRVGLFAKEFLGAPPAEQRAYQLATCAAGIVSVDGLPLYQPLAETVTNEEMFARKVEKLRGYMPVVITKIYHQILTLDGEFWELAQKLGKLDG